MPINPFHLDGRVAIVTGGSKGLGRGMAMALAGAGADVVVTSRNQTEGQLVADEVTKLGRRGLALQVDMRERAAIAEMVARTERDFGKIDILVNNAGVGAIQPAIDIDERAFTKLIDTNLRGCFLAAQAVYPGMKARQFGRIINVGSVASEVGFPGLAIYAATKHALLGLTRTLALEWAPFGITVNCLCPGFFETAMTADVKENDMMNAAVLAKVPLARWGQPRELDTAILFLAAPASGFVTGISLCVDGGYTAQ
jgi:NAD(P)-dependent dehydrogenase (short-subunit alcohol dehydrogenase family)